MASHANNVFFFNDPATTEIYTLSLHDALPILGTGAGGRARRSRGRAAHRAGRGGRRPLRRRPPAAGGRARDRKSTRLNSSHSQISYAVFCLKKKNIFKVISIIIVVREKDPTAQ